MIAFLVFYFGTGLVMTVVSWRSIDTTFNSFIDKMIMSVICLLVAPVWGVVKCGDSLVKALKPKVD